MTDLRLQWSLDKGFKVIPGDMLVVRTAREYNPQHFHMKAEHLSDPDWFNAFIKERDWPALPVSQHQRRLTSALLACEIDIETLSTFQKVEVFNALADLSDGHPPQDTIARMECLR